MQIRLKLKQKSFIQCKINFLNDNDKSLVFFHRYHQLPWGTTRQKRKTPFFRFCLIIPLITSLLIWIYWHASMQDSVTRERWMVAAVLFWERKMISTHLEDKLAFISLPVNIFLNQSQFFSLLNSVKLTRSYVSTVNQQWAKFVYNRNHWHILRKSFLFQRQPTVTCVLKSYWICPSLTSHQILLQIFFIR